MEKNENPKNKTEEDEVEKILNSVWKNWESRRRCEKTHVPKFIKNKDQHQ